MYEQEIRVTSDKDYSFDTKISINRKGFKSSLIMALIPKREINRFMVF